MEMIDCKNLLSCTDEELATLSQRNNSNALNILLSRYKNLIKLKCKNYFIQGADREDLFQEGLIGLFKATRDYKTSMKVPFRFFASICIKRQIITAVKTATRQKHIPLNTSISLYKAVNYDESRKLIDIYPVVDSHSPEHYYIAKEELNEIEHKLVFNLSKLEYNALILYLDGKTYAEIALSLKVNLKSVTNTMYRLQKKLKKLKHEFTILHK